jgi:hypothetical protein
MTQAATALACEPVHVGQPLPVEVPETSGLAASARDTALFWTHNDAGHGPDLYAVSTDGHLAGRVRITNATSVDWEDIETAPCGGRTCLYIGDIGDNDGARDHVTVYRVPEPPAGATTASADALHARYPHGPRDAEALFVHAGDLYLITKGRHDDIALYRWPGPGASGVSTLESIRVLGRMPGNNADRVTAASATRDGQWVGVRTYRTLFLFPADDFVSGAAVEAITYDLSPLNEPQGEGLVLLDDGTVWLTSEGGRGRGPSWSRLQCRLPGQRRNHRWPARLNLAIRQSLQFGAAHLSDLAHFSPVTGEHAFRHLEQYHGHRLVLLHVDDAFRGHEEECEPRIVRAAVPHFVDLAEPRTPVRTVELADQRAVLRYPRGAANRHPFSGAVAIVGEIHVRIVLQLVDLVGLDIRDVPEVGNVVPLLRCHGT